MKEHEYADEAYCEECDVHYSILHDEIETPCYCAFCGEKLAIKDDPQDWDDDEDAGC